MNINNQKIINIVKLTLDELYEKEKYLFENDLSERNMVFHFARYFSYVLSSYDFNGLSVDCEYNRNSLNTNGQKEIYINNIRRKIYPDLILHERGSNLRNILAIEFKKSNNKRIDYDIKKICYLTDSKYEYRYTLGMLIILGKSRDDVKINIFKNGIEVNY